MEVAHVSLQGRCCATLMQSFMLPRTPEEPQAYPYSPECVEEEFSEIPQLIL